MGSPAQGVALGAVPIPGALLALSRSSLMIMCRIATLQHNRNEPGTNCFLPKPTARAAAPSRTVSIVVRAVPTNTQKRTKKLMIFSMEEVRTRRVGHPRPRLKAAEGWGSWTSFDGSPCGVALGMVSVILTNLQHTKMKICRTERSEGPTAKRQNEAEFTRNAAIPIHTVCLATVQ